MNQTSPPPETPPFWQSFLASAPEYEASRFYESFYFADSEAVANHLADLVLCGVKRATAALVWGLEAEGKAPPRAGDLSIVTDWPGKPICVIETESTEVVPFDEVTAEFAATEGEGDKTLEYWRKEHWAYFSRECSQIAREPSAKMPILCEIFRVVYPPPRANAA
jgi:uncharacterized protein YhfF